MTNFDDFLKEQLKDSEIKAEYDALETEFAEIPNQITQSAIEDAVNGKDLHGPFDSVEALMKDLNS